MQKDCFYKNIWLEHTPAKETDHATTNIHSSTIMHFDAFTMLNQNMMPKHNNGTGIPAESCDRPNKVEQMHCDICNLMSFHTQMIKANTFSTAQTGPAKKFTGISRVYGELRGQPQPVPKNIVYIPSATSFAETSPESISATLSPGILRC